MSRWKKKAIAIKPSKRPKLSGEGFGGRLVYFLKRALSNVRQNVFVNVVTIGTITLALFIVALFLLVFVNMENAADNWSERVQITLYFNRELPATELTVLRGRITALADVSHVGYVSREEAMKRFKNRLRGQETLLEGVRQEVLPSSLEITLKRSGRDTQSVESVVTALKRIPGVTEVQYGEEWVKRFNTFLNFMRLLGALLGAFLVIAVIFIVSNTIKLTIYARRDELEVMSLVGATKFFIKAPFLIEGVIQGGTGALLAMALLLGSYELFLYNADSFLVFSPVASSLSFLPIEYVGAIFLAGVLLGFIGSMTSLKRFISI